MGPDGACKRVSPESLHLQPWIDTNNVTGRGRHHGVLGDGKTLSSLAKGQAATQKLDDWYPRRRTRVASSVHTHEVKYSTTVVRASSAVLRDQARRISPRE